MKNTIAVIVTHNRLANLKDCILSLRSQTRIEDLDILVVDNASSDGTTEYLKNQEYLSCIIQANLGGAGGFYTGMKYAYDKGYEWIWLMDDDGMPQNNQLEMLLSFNKKYPQKNFLNALVLDINDHTRFAFESQRLGSVENAQKDEYIDNFIKPFNGTLINRSVVERIGFVKKEMFIWGDEREYVSRARKNGIYPTTVTGAIHYHPREKGMVVYAFPHIKVGRLLQKPEALSHIYYRNEGYIQRNYGKGYHGLLTRIKFVFFNLVYFIRVGNVTELRKFCTSYHQGVKGIF